MKIRATVVFLTLLLTAGKVLASTASVNFSSLSQSGGGMFAEGGSVTID